MTMLCPVGFCHPAAAKPLAVVRAGDLCTRHYGKLSGPMRQQLGSARRRGSPDFEKVLGEAVAELRSREEWAPWVIVERARIEPHREWEELVKRFFGLLEDDLEPAARSTTTGHEIETRSLRAYSPHRAEDSRGTRLAHGPTIAKTISATYRRFANCGTGMPVWPNNTTPRLVNEWTGEELTWAEACEVARQGHRAIT